MFITLYALIIFTLFSVRHLIFFYNLSNFATSFSCFAEMSFLFRVFSGISRDSCHPYADLEGISSRRASTTVYSKIQYQFRGSAAFRRAVDL